MTGIKYRTAQSNAGHVLVWGGAQEDSPDASSVWEYDVVANSWTERKPVSGPKLNGYAAMAYDAGADKAVLYGGNSEGLDETWEYDYKDNTWTQRIHYQEPFTEVRYNETFTDWIFIRGFGLCDAWGC